MYAPHASPQPPPLTTGWNPQLDLFLGALPRPDLPQEATGAATEAATRNTPRRPPPGPLAAAEWQRQEGRLARAAKTGSWRRQALVAEQPRPPPEMSPRPDEYPWAWPDFAWLTGASGNT